MKDAQYYIDRIIDGKLNDDEWLALEIEVDKWWKHAPKEEQDLYSESGYGETLQMLCSGIRYMRDPANSDIYEDSEEYDVWLDDLAKGGTTEEWNKLKADGKSVVKDSDTGIRDTSSIKENIGVHSVGKIDKNIYRCITEDIVTDEVIITDIQMQHILDRHPDAYKAVVEFCQILFKNLILS